MGVALAKIIGNGKAASRLAGGVVVCASLFVAAPALADDSLWGKAMGAIGMGGSSQPAPAAPAPAVTAPQPKTAASSGSAAPTKVDAPVANNPSQGSVEVAATPAPAQGNLFSNWFGLGRGNNDSANLPPVQVNAPAQPQKAINPVQTVAPPPPPPVPRATESSMWDKMLGSVGVGNGGTSMDSINYNERPKLAVPKERTLPQPPQTTAEAPATRGANGDALIKPPGDYLEKVRGADGNVSGLRPGDQPGDKKFFGLF